MLEEMWLISAFPQRISRSMSAAVMRFSDMQHPEKKKWPPKTPSPEASTLIADYGTVYTNYHSLEFGYAYLRSVLEDWLHVVMSVYISCEMSRVIDAIEWVLHGKLRVRQLHISRSPHLHYCTK